MYVKPRLLVNKQQSLTKRYISALTAAIGRYLPWLWIASSNILMKPATKWGPSVKDLHVSRPLNASEKWCWQSCSLNITLLDTVHLDGCDWGPVSVPRDRAYHPTDTQPLEAQELTQSFFRYILPELAGAEIESSRLVCFIFNRSKFSDRLQNVLGHRV